MAKKFVLAAMLATSGFLAACSDIPTVKEMTVRMRDTSDIKILDMRSLVSKGLLTAQVEMLNDGARKNVAYRFKWLDKNKLQVGGDEAWKPITLKVGQRGTITGIAPTPAASDFKLELSSD
jgi:uncharacterized protein YcfL